MTRKQAFEKAFNTAPIAHQSNRSRRVHHTSDKLYHGPLRISADLAERALSALVYKTRHYHTVARMEEEGTIYLWCCVPAGEGDYLGEIVRTPEGTIRCHIHKHIVMREPWRGEPITVASVVARYAPDPSIPTVTIKEERAHFLDSHPPLAPPLPAKSVPLWQRGNE